MEKKFEGLDNHQSKIHKHLAKVKKHINHMNSHFEAVLKEIRSAKA